MAFPVVESTATSSTPTAGTNHVVTLPAGIQAGDLILICMDIGSTSATLNAHADYTELLDEAQANGLKVLYREAVGGETNPTFVSSANTRDATVAFRISGAAPVATQPPQVATTASGANNTPDGPANTPTGGAKDYLWVWFVGSAGEQADDGSFCTAFPTNYTANQLEKTCGVAGTNLGGLIAAATRTNNAASEDPGTATISETLGWRAQTIAVYPDPRIFVSGGVASETDSAPAGTIDQVQPSFDVFYGRLFRPPRRRRVERPAARVFLRSGFVSAEAEQTIPGGVAQEADSAPAGQVQQVYTAAPPSEADSVPAGQARQVYTASPALETDSVPVGQARQIYTASPASEADSVPAGSVQQAEFVGKSRRIFIAARRAFRRKPRAQVYLSRAQESAVAQTVSGGVAQEADSVPAGTVSQVGVAFVGQLFVIRRRRRLKRIRKPFVRRRLVLAQPQTILGGVALEQDSVPAGTIQQPAVSPHYLKPTNAVIVDLARGATITDLARGVTITRATGVTITPAPVTGATITPRTTGVTLGRTTDVEFVTNEVGVLILG